MKIDFEKINPETNFEMDGEHKVVNHTYIKNRILGKEYKKAQITKIGQVSARPLNQGELVKIYYYNHNAQIEEMPYTAINDRAVLVVKSIGGRNYNSIMDCLSFHKHYYWDKKVNAYMPVFDPFIAYVNDEKIKFLNMYKQQVTLHPGDFICPYDLAEFKAIYSIFKYNFDDNYAFVNDEAQMLENFAALWNE